jgi:hypothetical protein
MQVNTTTHFFAINHGNNTTFPEYTTRQGAGYYSKLR